MNGTRTLRNLMFAGVMILAATACLSCSSPAPPTPTSTLPPSLPTPAPTLTPTPAATPTPEPLVYVVESGDTLSDIASRFGTTVEAIMDLNGLTDTMIYSGTELRIPEGEQPAPSPPAPEPTEAAEAPSPPETAPATATSARTSAPISETQDWQTFCQPSPKEEEAVVANLQLGSTVQLDAYLYVKSVSMKHDGMMPFTLRGIPYQSGDAGWVDACQIHLLIPVGTGRNQVKELPDKFPMGQVLVWDANGTEIQGWQGSLDSFHVQVVGVVVEPYGGETGLEGSNTIRLEGIHLLES